MFSAEKKYYLFRTTSPNEGFQCYESADLVNWKLDGWSWRVSPLHVAHGGLQSPCVFSYRGLYYLVYNAKFPGAPRFGLAASTQPQGAYHDVHSPWLSLAGDCSNPSVFVDRNEKAFLVFSRSSGKRAGSRGIYAAALNADLSALSGPPALLLRAEERWELADSSPGLDVGCLFRIGSKYYLTYSAGDPAAGRSVVGYATADKPLGPWTKNEENPLLNTVADLKVISPNRGRAFQSLDRKNWFLLYESGAAPGGASGGSIQVQDVQPQAGRQLVTNPASRRVLNLN